MRAYPKLTEETRKALEDAVVGTLLGENKRALDTQLADIISTNSNTIPYSPTDTQLHCFQFRGKIYHNPFADTFYPERGKPKKIPNLFPKLGKTFRAYLESYTEFERLQSMCKAYLAAVLKFTRNLEDTLELFPSRFHPIFNNYSHLFISTTPHSPEELEEFKQQHFEIVGHIKAKMLADIIFS